MSNEFERSKMEVGRDGVIKRIPKAIVREDEEIQCYDMDIIFNLYESTSFNLLKVALFPGTIRHSQCWPKGSQYSHGTGI